MPLPRDENFVPVAGGVTDDEKQEIRPLKVNPQTGALKTEVTEMPPVSTEPSFSDANDVAKKALVDDDRHIQTDVLSIPPVKIKNLSDDVINPSTEDTLQNVLYRLDEISNQISEIRNNTPPFIDDYGAQHLAKTDDGGYIQTDIRTLPPLPAGTNKIGSVDVKTLPLIEGKVGILSGKSRIGNITITRNASNYITQITITEGGVTRTINITRDAKNYITGISETIS